MKRIDLKKRALMAVAAAAILCSAILSNEMTVHAGKAPAPVVTPTDPAQPPVISLDRAMTKSMKASLDKLNAIVPNMKGRKITALADKNGIAVLRLAVKDKLDHADVVFNKKTGFMESFRWPAYLDKDYKSEKAPDAKTTKKIADKFLHHMFGKWSEKYEADPVVKPIRSNTINDANGNPLKTIAYTTVNYWQMKDGKANKNDRISVQVDGNGRVTAYEHTVIPAKLLTKMGVK
jgi:hypothetical protein